MKKIILTFGLVSGVVLSAMMVLTLPLHDRIGNDAALVVGYTTMVAASIAIYFGVRRYRDAVAGGSVSFGRAFLVGAAIACVSSACYTATWEVVYFNFKSDYLTNYQAHELERARQRGATPAELAKKQADFAALAKLYQNPVVNSAMTFMEPLPVGLLVALISAGVLRRRRPEERGAAELAQVV